MRADRPIAPVVSRAAAQMEAQMAGIAKLPASVNVFISYSHRDETLKQELLNHLNSLKKRGLISDWHDGEIRVGAEWGKAITEELNRAQIILLLISSDFLGSDFCYDVEVKRAMERHDAGEARVIPIILRDCDWRGAPFSKLKALPKDGKAVTSRAWANVDEAFANVAEGIRTAVEELVEAQVKHLFEKLSVAEANRNWPNAIKLGKRILEVLPDHPEGIARTARAYFNNAIRKTKAQEPYKGFDIDLDFGSFGERICITASLGEETRQDIRRAIELDPTQGDYYYWYSASSFDDDGLANLSRAIERDPTNGKYHYIRSILLDGKHLNALTENMEMQAGFSHRRELREQARGRGHCRVNQAAQRDFEKAVELGYEHAVKEKQGREDFEWKIRRIGDPFSLPKFPWHR
jgi:hypothetical protein